MNELKFMIVFLAIVAFLTVIGRLCVSTTRDTIYSRIEYVRANNSQTTITLNRGLRAILRNEDPEAMDKTVKRYYNED